VTNVLRMLGTNAPRGETSSAFPIVRDKPIQDSLESYDQECCLIKWNQGGEKRDRVRGKKQTEGKSESGT